jgi:TRAP-type C4-dicarboxylate transport system permease small subunit
MSLVENLINKIDRVIFFFAKLSIFIMMLVIALNAIFRYFFNSPIQGVYEFTEKYLMVSAIFLSLSYVFKLDGHIRVDAFFDKFPKKIQSILDIVFMLIGAVLMFVIFYQGMIFTYKAWVNNDISTGVIAWPLWLSYIWIPIGGFVFTLRLLLNVINGIFSLFPRN